MLKTHLKRVTLFAILGAIIGGTIYQFSPKVYEGSVQLLIATEPTASNSSIGTTDAAQILSTGTSQNVGTEISILRSRGLFENALATLVREKNLDRGLLRPENLDPMFLTYDVLGERDSRAALVVVKAHNPDLAADLAYQIYMVYNSIRLKSSDESIQHATNVLTEQSEKVAADLHAAEGKLRDFKTQNHMVDLNSKASQLVSYGSNLTAQLDAAKADLAVQVATLNSIRSHLGDRPVMTTENYTQVESPVVSKLQDYLATLETQRAEALRIYTVDSKKIKDIDDLLAKTKERLVDARKDAWRQTSKSYQKDPVRKNFDDTLITGNVNKASLQRKISSLSAVLATVDQQIKQMPADEMILADLVRKQQLLDGKYKNLQAALGDLKYKGSAGMQQARLLFKAEPQRKPVAPDLMRLMIVCTMGGAIVGFLFSLARESLRATAQTSNELSALLGLPVSATVPMLQPRQARAVFRSLPDASFKPLESFKFMAFAMLYGKDKAPKRVLFTSVGGAVGCSTASAQYAIAAAKTGVNVVLVDADLRHETLTNAFGVTDKSGLREIINCLLLPSDTTEIAVQTSHPSLKIVPAGTSGGDGITDVPVGNIQAFLDDLQSKSGLVVIDAPPCDVVSDAMRFTPYVDEVVLVCSARTTKYTSVLPAIDLLKRAGAESVRLVMTGTSPEEEAFSRRSLYVVR